MDPERNRFKIFDDAIGRSAYEWAKTNSYNRYPFRESLAHGIMEAFCPIAMRIHRGSRSVTGMAIGSAIDLGVLLPVNLGLTWAFFAGTDYNPLVGVGAFLITRLLINCAVHTELNRRKI